jgi:hypothetical protein
VFRRSTSEFGNAAPQDHTSSNPPSSVLTNNHHTGLVYEKTLEMVDITNDPDCPRAGRHCELKKAEVKKCEESVQCVLAAVSNFTNPFTVTDKNRLYSVASGAPWILRSRRRRQTGVITGGWDL